MVIVRVNMSWDFKAAHCRTEIPLGFIYCPRFFVFGLEPTLRKSYYTILRFVFCSLTYDHLVWVT